MTKNNEEKIINFLFDCKKCKLKSEEECLIYERCYKANEYICNLNKNLKAKEQECEELKEDYATAKSMYDLCQSDFMELAKIKDKYKQTLTEIKELCNKTLCDYLQCSLNYNHSKDFECEKTSCNRAKRRKFILEILQKINEVENVNNNR